jgi:maltooligosyltrehalose trehalohydrolase
MRPGVELGHDGGAEFRVWAPRPREVVLLLDGTRRVPMARDRDGWCVARVPGVVDGARYQYVIDGKVRPDPASRRQPDGVHGPSQIVDPRRLPPRRPGPRRPMGEQVLYELHVGTFTAEGTLDAAGAELGRLAELGVTAVELMPVGSFPGRRNWGYDGVAWWAVQECYGGPPALARFVDEAHRLGLAVVLDVVYNHLGPEGNYLGEYGPYFTSRRQTPWGDALDYALPAVRAHAVENARMWIRDYGVDGLRLDAVHAIFDDCPEHVVAEIARAAQEEGGFVIAESDLGDVRVIEPRSDGGWGCDAQWADDFHHALHVALTGERHAYYADYQEGGGLTALARAIENGFTWTGQRAPSRGRAFGTPSRDLAAGRFVICAQNHDQIGNRARGERLDALVPGSAFATLALLFTSPGVPLLFQGEEHADPAPFLYFTDHGDPDLCRAVSEGRRREFAWASVSDFPDPQDPATFARSRIDLTLGERAPRHAGVRRFTRALLALRRARPSLAHLDRARVEARPDLAARVMILRRWRGREETLTAISVGREASTVALPAPRAGGWRIALDAGDPRFGGPAGAHLDPAGERLALPPLGAVVLVNQ